MRTYSTAYIIPVIIGNMYTELHACLAARTPILAGFNLLIFHKYTSGNPFFASVLLPRRMLMGWDALTSTYNTVRLSSSGLQVRLVRSSPPPPRSLYSTYPLSPLAPSRDAFFA